MKKVFTCFLLLVLGFGGKAVAQPFGKFIGSYNVPAMDFPTLAKLLDTLNYYGVKGPVTIELLKDETAPSGGYRLGSDSLHLSLSPASSLRINGNGHLLTAQAGTGATDGIFKIQGADYVTIDKLNLAESSGNTTATTMMEWGYAIVRRTANDAVKTLTIQNSKITLNKTNTTAASGASPNGSTGIFTGSCLPNSTTLLPAPSIDSGSHSGIFLFQDTIQNVTNGIYANGSVTIADGVNLNDNGMTVQANEIHNFTQNGIFLSYFHNALVKGNYLDNMAGGGVAPTANSIWGIRYATNYATAYNNGWTSEGNNVKLTINTPAGSYHATGVSTQNKGTGITAINGDTVELVSTGASAQLNGIFSQNTNGSQSISGNVVHKFVTQTTNAQAVIGIFSGGYCTYSGLGVSDVDCYPGAATVANNIIDSFNVSSGTASALTSIFACQDDNMTAGVSPFIGNRVSDININATSAGFFAYGGVYRRNNSALLRTTNINNNIITRVSATGALNGTPIILIRPTGPYYGAHTINFVSNKVSKITAVSGRLTVMDADDGLALTISKDTITDLSGGFHVIGFLTANSGVGTKTIQMDNTSITLLKSTSLKSGAFVAGIYILPGTGTTTTQTVTMNNNTIFNLLNNDTLGAAFGMNMAGGTAGYTVYNNVLSEISAPAATAAYNSSFGINMQGTGNNKLFYNTINMKSGATSGTGYGATGIVFNAGGTNTIQNNIVRVNVLAGTANNVSAMRSVAGAALSAPSVSGFTASNNIYFSPTGSNNYLYVEGTTNAGLVNGYHVSGLTENATKNIANDTFFNSDCNKSSYHKFMNAATPTREKGTFTEDNLVGGSGVYAPAGTSYAEAGALDIAITEDMKKTARPAGASDIGAREFNGTTLPKLDILVTSSTGKDTACIYNLPSLTASVPSYFNRVSYQWYKDTTRIPGATGTKLDVDVAGGTYIVKIYDSATGCEYAGEGFKMAVVPPPPAMITYYDSLLFCETGAVVLFANSKPDYIYQWFKNGTPLPVTDDHYVASTTGSYTVEVNTSLGCPSLSEPIKVTVYPLPKPTIFWAGPRVLSTQTYYTYQWYKNNIKIDSFSQGPSYFALDDGAYTVEVTDSNGCTSKSTIYLFTVGIEDQQLAEAVKVFPNPTSGKVFIQSPISVYTELTDIMGRVLLAHAERKEIDLGNYAEGVYLLSVTDKAGNLVRKEKIVRNK